MILNRVTIKNFRNLKETTLDFQNGLHYLFGLNGQGKTSVLEAIHLLSNLKSFREAHLQSCIQQGKNLAIIEGELLLKGSDAKVTLKVEIDYSQQRIKKRAMINGKLTKSSSDYFALKTSQQEAQFHVVSLNPTSTDLVRGEPQIRRLYLNLVTASENPELLETLKRYQKILDQKNAHLKEERQDLEFLSVLNSALAKEGAKIIKNRLFWLSKITPKTSRFLKQIAPHQSQVYLGLKTLQMPIFPRQFDEFLRENQEDYIEQKLLQLIRESGSMERARAVSLVGPHRDDLLFRVSSDETEQDHELQNLAEVGSQGEVRSMLLAMKLAELESFQEQTGVTPLLLIDDFSSELDEQRRNFLLSYLKDARLQVFVTSTEDRWAPSQGLRFEVVQGKVVVV